MNREAKSFTKVSGRLKMSLGCIYFPVADIEPLYLSVPLFSQIKEVGEVVN